VIYGLKKQPKLVMVDDDALEMVAEIEVVMNRHLGGDVGFGDGSVSCWWERRWD